MKRIAILGAGAMGSAITAPLCDSGNSVNLWGTEFDTTILNTIAETGMHPSLKAELPKGIHIFYHDELDKALNKCDTVFIAVVSDVVKSIVERALPYMGTTKRLVILSKGLHMENKRIKPLSKAVEEVIGSEKISVISVGGPCIAEELIRRVPTAAVYASRDLNSALECKKSFETDYYKIFITNDIIGVELCAALKNVYAIAVSWSEGLAKGLNLKSMFNLKSILVTQAVKEMARIIEKLGGKSETAFGLAGLGDLDVTTRKYGGRNLLFGNLLGEGMNTKEALEYMSKKGIYTIEGIPTAIRIYEILKKDEESSHMLEGLPLLRSLVGVIQGRLQVKEAIPTVLKNIKLDDF